MSAADSTTSVEYRAIPDFPGYRVGDDGSVWTSKRRADWLRLKPWIDRDGYHSVRILGGDGYWNVRIHRLVLMIFVGPCPKGMVAAHNNGIRSDNRRDNLRWATQSDNCADKVGHGTAQVGSAHGMAILSEEQVAEVFVLASEGWFAQEIASKFGVKRITIHKILNREHWTHVRPPIERSPNIESQQKMVANVMARGMSTADIAAAVGLSRAMVNAVRRGDRTMRLRHEVALERVYGQVISR